MEATQELVQLSKGNEEVPSSNHVSNTNNTSVTNHTNRFRLPKLIHYKWWSRVMVYIVFLLAGQTTATLLGRLYFDKGGNSKWMATLVQSAGFPVVFPVLIYFSTKKSSRQISPSIGLAKLAVIYFVLGVALTGDNLMYSYGLVYLPVSTYSLLCATQLAFNAVTSFFINAQKFTILVLNSLVLLTISACLLAINVDNDGSTTSNVSRGHFTIGFLCTIGASATYSLLLSTTQFCFEKVIKNESFTTVLSMQMYPSFVATCASAVGLLASGDWSTLHKEMKDYKTGQVSYVMTLVSTALTWQMSSVGLLGLIFEVSSLFGNVISTLGLPLVPVFAVVFFHDTMSGVKVVSLVLAVWGFMSYIYQHYLDDAKKALVRTINEDHVPCTSIDLY
ncbi:hypothetical protein vseg_016699 [Gypsophila vaccaria]